ncbi:MAG TPA: hypothetical protein VLZ89_02460 [Anaerolineales bacterium]|nr:hypothetical protein [Anaerolineales bacterium]
MKNLTRRKMMTITTTIALVTIAAVILTKLIGALVVAAFLAGAGTAIVIIFVILADVWLRRTEKRK